MLIFIFWYKYDDYWEPYWVVASCFRKSLLLYLRRTSADWSPEGTRKFRMLGSYKDSIDGPMAIMEMEVARTYYCYCYCFVEYLQPSRSKLRPLAACDKWWSESEKSLIFVEIIRETYFSEKSHVAKIERGNALKLKSEGHSYFH